MDAKGKFVLPARQGPLSHSYVYLRNVRFHTPPVSLGSRIKEARLAAGFTSQKALGKAMNVERATVSLWEKDRHVPEAWRMPILAEKLGVSIDWLSTGKGRGPGQKNDASIAIDGSSNEPAYTDVYGGLANIADADVANLEAPMQRDVDELIQIFGRLRTAGRFALLEYAKTLEKAQAAEAAQTRPTASRA